MTTERFVQDLHKTSQKTAASRLQIYCSSANVQVYDLMERNFQPSYKNLVMILIVSSDFYQSLKFFFNWESTAPLLKLIYKNGVPEGEKEHLIVDMFKEVANLSAGQMKRLLNKSNIHSDISLPISMRGYDDLFSNQSNNPQQYTQSWKFEVGDSNLIFTSAIESRGDLSPHQLTEEVEDNDDSIEFF